MLWAAIAGLLTAVIVGFVYWQIKPDFIAASTVKGSLVAIDIWVIIFGALFFLEVLRSHEILENVGLYLEHISRDYRVQVVLLAWFLENFIEGTAGFGTPTAVAAPLLMAIGFSPITSVVLALLGNSSAVVFGAAGTPIRVGFEGLMADGVPLWGAVLNFVGVVMPVFMVWIAVKEKGHKKSDFYKAVPMAITAGLSFLIASLLCLPLGQEFPSILGSVIGLAFFLAALKTGFLMPKRVLFSDQTLKTKTRRIIHVVLPYAFLVILLILGKFLVGGVSWKINILGDIKHSLNLYTPGLFFFLAGIPFVFWWSKKEKAVGFIKEAILKAIEPFLVIAAISSIVQLMVNSGNNFSHFPSMLEVSSQAFRNALLPLFAPILGAFGALATGSATVSNLMFGEILQTASLELGLNTALVLALSCVGASAGNMVALADMLTAQAAVGIKQREVEILKRVFIPCLIYVLILGLIGLLASRLF